MIVSEETFNDFIVPQALRTMCKMVAAQIGCQPEEVIPTEEMKQQCIRMVSTIYATPSHLGDCHISIDPPNDRGEGLIRIDLPD